MHCHSDGDSSFGRASDSKARRNTDAGSSPRCGKGFFSFSADSLTLSVQSPCAVTYISIWAHAKHWQPYPGLATRQYCSLGQDWVALGARQTLAAISWFGHTTILFTGTGLGSAGRTPNTGSHILVWPHDNTVHWDRTG